MKAISVFICTMLLVPVAIAQSKLSVPSDKGTEYYVLDKATEWPMAVIITKRVGSSGTSYSSRLYDCSNGSVKYLGSGDTREQMENSQPDKSMGSIVHGSITYYVGLEACK